jgi:hypothetical protein
MTDLSTRELIDSLLEVVASNDSEPSSARSARDVEACALTLRDRLPAQALIERCVEEREATPDRSFWQRLFGVRPLSSDARSWFQGALGELKVARGLEGLGHEWTVLHSVPVGQRGSDIDHIVIGPSGVFTINSKFHERQRVWVSGSTLRVGGYPTQHLRNAEFEGQRASQMMSRASGIDVHARPLVVIIDAQSISYGPNKPTVPVVSLGKLSRMLRRSRHTLSATECAYFADVAADPSTWSPVPLYAAEPDLRERFDALQREMRSASLVRVGWVAGLAVALALAAVGYLTLMV